MQHFQRLVLGNGLAMTIFCKKRRVHACVQTIEPESQIESESRLECISMAFEDALSLNATIMSGPRLTAGESSALPGQTDTCSDVITEYISKCKLENDTIFEAEYVT